MPGILQKHFRTLVKIAAGAVVEKENFMQIAPIIMKETNNGYRLSFAALIFVSVFLVAASFLYPKWKITGTEATISWDVMGYYLYLPSYFYDDISKLHNLQYILDTYHPVDGFGNAFQISSGNYMMKYSMGMALMYLPFFAVAHLWAHAGGYAVDGFSYPYQVMISFGSLLISLIGLWFARKSLLKYFSDAITAIALIVLVLATNYFNYVSFAGAMTHNYLFTIYSIVIWLTIQWYERPDFKKSFCIGILCGLATVTRPTEIIILIIPFLWGLQSWKGIKDRIQLFWNHRIKILITAFAFMLPILPQLFYWKAISGEWIYYSYQDQGFSWDHPHIYAGLFTFKNSWLVYTPVMALALTGFIFLFLKRRNIFWALFFFTIINIYIVYSWDIWWYGGSFGSRAMIQSYALLIFPLAAFFDWVREKTNLAVLTTAGVCFCIWMNLLQTYQCHSNGIFEAENMTRAYYWRIFGKTSIKPLDKKMLDKNEDMPPENMIELQPLYEMRSPEFDSLMQINSFSPNALVMLNDSIQFSKEFAIPVECNKDTWYRVSVSVFFPDKEWNSWEMTQFYVKLFSQQNEVKSNMIRIQRITDQGRWQEVFADIKCPDLNTDLLKISFWNGNSKKSIFIDNLKVERSVIYE